MSSTKPFFDAVKGRRSMYDIHANNAPISNARVQEIVETAIKNVPSSYNSQSGRAVLLSGESNAKFFDIVEKHVRPALPEGMWEKWLGPRLTQHRAGAGTVMFFEDDDALERLKQKNPMVTPLVTEWSDTSNGMNQFTVWTALEAEGFGASLQHFNFHPAVSAEVLETWNLPKSWKLKAQLVYGVPSGKEQLPEKTQEPIEERVKNFS